MKRTPVLGALLAAGVLLAGCGGGSDAAKADPQTWPDQWCRINIGDTPDRAIELMGKPTYDNRDRQSGSLQWDHREYQFNLFLGMDDRVRQLDINTIAMSPAQIAALKCASTRSSASPDGGPAMGEEHRS